MSVPATPAKRGRYELVPYDDPEVMEAPGRSGNPSAFGGVYHGKFKTPIKRPNPIKGSYSGYTEKIMHSGFSTQKGCWYMNLAAAPLWSSAENAGAGNDPTTIQYYSEVLRCVCVAILRKFYKRYHPGRLEFVASDQPIQQFLSLPASNVTPGTAVQLDADNPGNINYMPEILTLCCVSADGYSQVKYQYTLTDGDTLQTLAKWLAGRMWTAWSSNTTTNGGMEPLYLAVVDSNSAANVANSKGFMYLNNMDVAFRVMNILSLHNQSGDHTVNGVDNDDTTIEIDANPLKGRIFYHKGIAPTINIGYCVPANGAHPVDGGASSVGANPDIWGPDNLTQGGTWNAVDNPSVNTPLANCTFPYKGNGQNYVEPTGVWRTLPKAEYFKRCYGVREVNMEPGVINKTTLAFDFKGKLTTLLRKLSTEYYYRSGNGSPAYDYGMGKSMTIAFERRIRNHWETVANPVKDYVSIAFQIVTTIEAEVRRRNQVMAQYVRTNC